MTFPFRQSREIVKCIGRSWCRSRVKIREQWSHFGINLWGRQGRQAIVSPCEVVTTFFDGQRKMKLQLLLFFSFEIGATGRRSSREEATIIKRAHLATGSPSFFFLIPFSWPSWPSQLKLTSFRSKKYEMDLLSTASPWQRPYLFSSLIFLLFEGRKTGQKQ